MDEFKDILQAEIASKRRQLEDLGGPRKYVKQVELDRQERREREGKTHKNIVKGGNLLDEGKKEPKEPSQDEQKRWAEIRQIERRLRAKGQPVRLFGETDEQRIARLETLEKRQSSSEEHQDNDGNTLESTRRSVSPRVIQPTRPTNSKEDKVGNASPSLERTTSQSPLPNAMETDPITIELLKTEPAKVRALIALFLRRLLGEMEARLRDRSEEESSSREGRLATVACQQSKEHLNIFLRLLRKDHLPPDMMQRIVEICRFLQIREYVKANDVYLKLSIGNAPWPIGVTAVGIHERSAQERIDTSQVAHVLNDETTRKWIQAIKRLMTFCQTRYPPAERAKMMG